MKSSPHEANESAWQVWERQGLRFLAHLTSTYAKTILTLCLLLAGLAAWYTARHLEFVTSNNDLISSDKRYLQLDKEYTDEFVGVDQLVVVIEPRDVPQGKDFATKLAEVLARDTEHIAEVFYRIDTTSLEGKKLLYLSQEDLRALQDNLTENYDLVHNLATTPGLNTLMSTVNKQVSAGMVSHLVSNLFGFESAPEEGTASPQEEKNPLKIEFLKSLLQEMERALHDPAYGYRSPWAKFFGGTEELSDNGFLVSGNRRFVFVMIEPKESSVSGEDGDERAIATVRQAISELKPAFPGLDAGVTGTTAINTDEMLSAQANGTLAALVSLIGVTLLYTFFFRKIRHPLLIVTALTVGLAWAMGFATLTVGHLTVITAFVAPILIGLADDFGVHFVTRYEQERQQGYSPRTALTIVFEQTVPGIIAGGITATLAFFAVMLTDFRGVQELGLITGGGLVLSLVATLTFLPALIIVVETYRPWAVSSGERTFLTGLFTRLGHVMVKTRWLLLVTAGILTISALVVLPTVSFDYNLLNLQARGTESVVWEKRIIANSERSSWNALTTARTPSEAMQKAAVFEALSSVESVESVASLIPEQQDQRLELVQSLRPLFQELPQSLSAPVSVDTSDLLQTLDKIKLKVREGNTQWDPQRKPEEADLQEIRRSLLAVIAALQRLPANEAQMLLEERFQKPLFGDFQDKWQLLQNNVNPLGPITLDDVPPQLKSRFVSADEQKFLLQIYPKKDIWNREPLEEFIGQLRQVDADVTGSPIIAYESIKAMKAGYIEGAFYAFFAVLLIAFLSLRRLYDTAMAMIPLVLGMIWMAGLMWLFDLKFNLANMIVVPLIVGIGVENGIHIIHRYREEKESGAALVSGSTGQSVALFSLTTMIGFGSLMLAKHQGVFSMGLLLMLAVGSVLIASLIVLPLLLSPPRREEREATADVVVEEEELTVRKRAAR